MVHQFQERHALEDLVPLETATSADHLAVAVRQAIVTVLAAAGQERAVASVLSSDEDISVRFSAPGEWMVVSGVQTPDLLHQALSALLGETAYCIDQSHGRMLLRLSGPNARAILAKGVGIDLHASAFAIGQSTNVLCGHISINLSLVGENQFEIIVMRSFAESLLHDLRQMGREFDLSVSFSA
jgi:heterotetrameric sarcosine oxidase gamma subunit